MHLTFVRSTAQEHSFPRQHEGMDYWQRGYLAACVCEGQAMDVCETGLRAKRLNKPKGGVS